jgi:predicted O-linked N-acetylglucosamine transferase (SPINDLY family)
MGQATVDQAMQLALQHQQAGRLERAEQIYRQILAQSPEHARAMHYLGFVAHQLGRSDAGIYFIRRAIALEPDDAEAYCNLAIVLEYKGQFDEAIAACRRAIALRADFPEAHCNLGNALNSNGHLDEAIAAYRRAIALRPDLAEAHCNLGNALKSEGHLDEAIAAYREAIAQRSDFAEAYSNFGAALKDKGLLDEAIAAYRRAVALRPDQPEAHGNLGVALQDQGRLDEAIAAWRQAIAVDPGLSAVDSNLVFSLHFHPAYNAQAIAREHRRWNEQHARPLRKSQPHGNDPDPDRRLRIGYVSPDFRNHVVGRNLLPLFLEHDRDRFELFCYSNVPRPDELTAQFPAHCDGWRNIVGLSDERTAELVREDQIDILVDVALHTARNRLLVFARKPAPVQVTFAGYPGTTGLEAIDYRLTDPHLDPPGQGDEIYAESSIRLPDSFWCYDPAIMTAGLELAPQASPLPALSTAGVTFGCLGNFCKVNDPVLTLWSRVLNATSGSRLMLMAPAGSARHRTLEVLGRQGIDPARIDFVASASIGEYLQRYRKIDIALDTFPYNGHTTSLDALWMGVPVVTLIGTTGVGRAGLSQLTNLGLTELAATSEDQYVRIAADLAGDLPRLSHLRAGLRQRLRASVLTDAPRFARNIEAAYREMWQRWCRMHRSQCRDPTDG